MERGNRKSRVGVVVSNKMTKTVVIKVERRVPDRKYGEQVMASIILKKGMEMTEDEVRDFCREKIANYKIPKYVKFVDSYPMTASGKIQKFKMRDMAIKELALEDAGPTA